ncbi:Protein preY, mitochondrial [Exaiptasia diaphana]|nr:Protein preY, mitochondrial [Exaiptasia diaphana]
MAARRSVWRTICSPIILRQRYLITSWRGFSDKDTTQDSNVSCFDEKLLEILVCPLTKRPLRFDAASNQLISDEIGVAYPVVDGVPNLIPSDGHLIKSASNKDN